MNLRLNLLAWVGAGWLAGAGLGAPATSAAAPPNVLLILADDMGYGDPGCYNPQSKIPTPHIDGLAAEGLRFTDAHAAGSVCHPSRYGLLTGCLPWRTDIGKWRVRPLIHEGQMTVASLLRRRGYHTAMVGKWHLGFQENGYDQPLPGGPVDRGFDSFFGIRASTDIPPYFYIRDRRAVAPPTDHIAANHTPGWSPIQGAFWRAGGIAPGLALKDVLPRFTAEAEQILRARADKPDQPWFLYLAFPAPHTPWLPAAEFQGHSGAGLYGDFVTMVDAMIGRVLATLDAIGQADRTLVIFTSDNGPVWYARDVERFGHDSVRGWRGMKGDAWEAGHRMPFIVRWPGRVKAGSTSAQTLCFTDLLATLAAIVETPLPPDAGPDSFNFLPVLEGRQPADQPVRGPLLLRSANGMMHLRSGRWKLIDGLGSGGFSKPGRIRPQPGQPAGQLYDLQADPGETHNLYAQKPDLVQRLRIKLDRLHESEASRLPARPERHPLPNPPERQGS